MSETDPVFGSSGAGGLHPKPGDFCYLDSHAVTWTLADLAGLPGHGQAARMPAAHSMTPTLSYAA